MASSGLGDGQSSSAGDASLDAIPPVLPTPDKSAAHCGATEFRRRTGSLMIERVADLPAGVLGFRATGKITHDEYREMMKPIYATLEAHEKLNIYFELDDDFDGLDLGALWQDMRTAGSVGLKHRSSYERMALVTDKDWIRHAVAVMGPLAPGELRVFDEDDKRLAKAWITELVSR